MSRVVVVTGTGLSGAIKVGEQVRCLPGDHIFRVRSLQVHGQPVEDAGWGQRVALNLTGPDTAEVARGHVICHEKISMISNRFDAYLEVRPAARKGIKNHQNVRVHLGTAERLGKVIILGERDHIEPKQSAYCQITLTEPILAPDAASRHMGETREERILQFLEENDTPVVGLREGAMLRIEEGETVLRGSSGARVFRKGLEPIETLPGAHLNAFL